jgi:hypothetical protein
MVQPLAHFHTLAELTSGTTPVRSAGKRVERKAAGAQLGAAARGLSDKRETLRGYGRRREAEHVGDDLVSEPVLAKLAQQVG